MAVKSAEGEGDIYRTCGKHFPHVLSVRYNYGFEKYSQKNWLSHAMRRENSCDTESLKNVELENHLLWHEKNLKTTE